MIKERTIIWKQEKIIDKMIREANKKLENTESNMNDVDLVFERVIGGYFALLEANLISIDDEIIINRISEERDKWCDGIIVKKEEMEYETYQRTSNIRTQKDVELDC